MKRGTFKKKSYEEVIASQRAKNDRRRKQGNIPKLRTKTPLRAKKRLNKQGKTPISKIQKLLWAECRRIIRKKYPDTCYTCGATNLSLKPVNWQTGHMLAKASVGAYLKYDLRVLRPQCYLCNIRHGGRGADFIENMRRIEGDGYVDQILEDKKKIVNAYDHYVLLLNEYKQL